MLSASEDSLFGKYMVWILAGLLASVVSEVSHSLHVSAGLVPWCESQPLPFQCLPTCHWWPHLHLIVWSFVLWHRLVW
jgi:hypothetical protein